MKDGRPRALVSRTVVCAAVAALFTTAFTTAFCQAQSQPGDGAATYAIVVGYNGGAEGLSTLHYADDDAVRFSILLRGLNTPARPSRVWLLTDIDSQTTADLARAGLTVAPDGPPTRAALQAGLSAVGAALAARPHPADAAVLYIIYAGHGLQGRILLKPEGTAAAALTGHEIRAAVANLARTTPALRTILFVDACRSQSLFTERGGERELGPDLSAQISQLEERADAAQIGILTAAASGRPAGEVSTLGAGFFSHVLASGLAGAADANGDDMISFGELVAFVAFNTERLTGQRPWFAPPGGDLASVVIDHRGRGTSLDFATSPAGRYVVEAAPGRPVFVEVFKGDRRPLRLALPPGNYRVLHDVGDDRVRLSRIRLAQGQRLNLTSTAWGDAPIPSTTFARGDAVSDGRSQAAGEDAGPAVDSALAFSAPFTPEVVSTLTTGYDAGRKPAIALQPGNATVGVAFLVGAAPLDLGGTEFGGTVRYRRGSGAFFLGAWVDWARSSHDVPTAFTFDRYGASIEGGLRFMPAQRLTFAASVGLGATRVVRHGVDGAVSGDPLAPTISGILSLDFRVTGPWSVFGLARVQSQWIRVDGDRRASRDPAGQAGIALAF